MSSKRFVLTFPPELTTEPITYNLVKQFDIMINILNAVISPGKIGHLVLEMSAPTKVLRQAMDYIREHNVDCVPLEKKIHYQQDKCIHCGSCTAVCFAGALTMSHNTSELQFNAEKCVVCELCLKACPLKLFSIDISE